MFNLGPMKGLVMASASPVVDGIAGHQSSRSGNSFTFFKRFDGTPTSAEAAPSGPRIDARPSGADHRAAIRRGRR